MKRIVYYLLILVFPVASFMGCNTTSTSEEAGERLSLNFNENRTFKIAQFTDIHWKNDKVEECAGTTSIIRQVLEAEKPDLAVLTGDIVTGHPEAGWKAVTSIFVESGMKFAVVLGNHDDEAEWSRHQIFDFLETVPGFVGEKGPANVTGVGNYIIELKRPDTGYTSALLYFFDSNAYCEDKDISNYGWVEFDQIAWYREQSKHYTSENGDAAYPGLAFFHIPLPEYGIVAKDSARFGEFHEDVCSPKINTGLLAAFVEMKDVMGTFVGHDHVNNYIGMHKGVALAYGQSTGGYGDLPKGSRIIELFEGEHRFDTWVRTAEGTDLYYSYPAQTTE
ncbi:metallophosphoesterase family protein [Mariniphaga sediminis]|jgi:3',5'-cyclic AMP phosphodiesterase CpdA|uniref:metallophosphoesterase family protein n=1 Tax=Mariniphaga sediminis TaxID=1628158 RepID=UPI0035617C9B